MPAAVALPTPTVVARRPKARRANHRAKRPAGARATHLGPDHPNVPVRQG
jgi:hypothetical protein